jgi:hypothetical protein
LISSSSHTSSIPGSARYCKRSKSRGIGSRACNVRTVLRNSQSQSMIFSCLPKHLLRLASLRHVSLQLTPGKCNAALTWERTTTPSFDKCISVSRAWAPTLTAPIKAAMVFSGYTALYPRCAMACGKVMPSLDVIARVHVATCQVSFGQAQRYNWEGSHAWGTWYWRRAVAAQLTSPCWFW